MEAKLISCSNYAPVTNADKYVNLKAMIAKIARVSNPANEDNPDSDKLIQYLIEHKHWSPFEMCSACIEVITTRDIGRQMLRHRSFSFQEFSQRYADVFTYTHDNFEVRECRMQDPKNRQSSLPCESAELIHEWKNKQKEIIKN